MILPKTTRVTETTTLTLCAEFIADDSKKHLGFTGARCELPNGQVIETTGRRSPLYALARKLEALGFGDWALQAYTPTGTKSLRGKVSVMAGTDLREGPCGLERRNYRSNNPDDGSTQRDLGSEGTQPPEKPETRLSESPWARKMKRIPVLGRAGCGGYLKRAPWTVRKKPGLKHG